MNPRCPQCRTENVRWKSTRPTKERVGDSVVVYIDSYTCNKGHGNFEIRRPELVGKVEA